MSFPSESTTANRAVDPELLRQTRARTSMLPPKAAAGRVPPSEREVGMHPTMPAPDPSRGVAAEVDARRNHDPRAE